MILMQYVSDESLEDVKKEPNWSDIKANTNPGRLWELMVQKHKVHSSSEVKQNVKLVVCKANV
jgi:hypothetical protein